jgi:hypothetical protein
MVSSLQINQRFNLYKKDTNLYVIESIWSLGFDKEFFDMVKNNLIPILINTESEKGITNLIFWFKLELLFYNALNYNIKKVVSENYRNSSHLEYIKTVLDYRKKSTTYEFIKGFDKKAIDNLMKNLIKPNVQQLQQLGISKNSKNFKIKCKINIDGKTQKLSLIVFM